MERNVKRVRRRYRLTRAEAQVISELASGLTVAGIAQSRGVKPSTVRTQVRSIFKKTGLHRQSDVVRLALTGALPLAEAERALPQF